MTTAGGLVSWGVRAGSWARRSSGCRVVRRGEGQSKRGAEGGFWGWLKHGSSWQLAVSRPRWGHFKTRDAKRLQVAIHKAKDTPCHPSAVQLHAEVYDVHVGTPFNFIYDVRDPIGFRYIYICLDCAKLRRGLTGCATETTFLDFLVVTHPAFSVSALLLPYPFELPRCAETPS